MKLKKSGQVLLALAVSLGLSFGLTSCVNDYTVGYLYVTGSYQNQIGAFKISNNTGNLTNIPGSPFGSGGTNPVREALSSSGRYLYILNAGVAKSTGVGDGNFTYNASNIQMYSIGGDGVLAPQLSFQSSGYGPIRMALSSNGSFLLVLDEYSPAAGTDTDGNPLIASTTLRPGMSCQDSSGLYHPVGDITVFSVDPNTGRLSLVTNAQQVNAAGQPLTYFPVGCEPIDFKVTGSAVLTADTKDPVTGNNFTVFPYAFSSTTGQLTTTQNSEFVTGAASISAIGSDAATKYIYILDPVNNEIWYYTIGSNGLLSAVSTSPTPNSLTASGNPIQLTTDSKSKFLYIANAGPSTVVGNVTSDITSYSISSNGALQPTAPGEISTGGGPQCIIEDPSNQWIYTADYDTNTVSGYALDPSSGVLTKLSRGSTFKTVGNPTWCLADGHTD